MNFLDLEEDKLDAGWNPSGDALDVQGAQGTAHMRIKEIFDFARADGRLSLLEPEARNVFRLVGMPVPMDTLALSVDEAVEFQKSCEGRPLVMKLVSPQVIHKTDEGAVYVGLKTAEDVRTAAQDLFDRFEHRDMRGVLLYEMVPKGTEMIVGTSTDPLFGPTVVAGPGGAFVEILRDVCFSLCPTDAFDARIMVGGLKHQALLDGYRGDPAVNRNELADIIVAISKLAYEHSADIAEIDANPVLWCPNGEHWAVDARIIMHPLAEEEDK
jgi:acetyl-CoA synthetase (ADP-forming)